MSRRQENIPKSLARWRHGKHGSQAARAAPLLSAGAIVHLGGCLANLGSGLVWCLYVTLRTIFKSFFVHIGPLLALKGIRVSGAAVPQPSGDCHDSPGKKKMFL